MMPLDLHNQLGVALLAVFASLAARKLPIPNRFQAVVPLILCVIIFAVFVDLADLKTTAVHGLVSGLLASGILYVALGLSGRK